MPTSSAGTSGSASGVIVTVVSVATAPASKTSGVPSLLTVFFALLVTSDDRPAGRVPVPAGAAHAGADEEKFPDLGDAAARGAGEGHPLRLVHPLLRRDRRRQVDAVPARIERRPRRGRQVAPYPRLLDRELRLTGQRRGQIN